MTEYLHRAHPALVKVNQRTPVVLKNLIRHCEEERIPGEELRQTLEAYPEAAELYPLAYQLYKGEKEREESPPEGDADILTFTRK